MKYILFIFSFILFSCTQTEVNIKLGQGIMSGEVSSNSVILQTRLTSSDTLIDGFMPGKAGWGKFEWTSGKDWNKALSSPWIAGEAENDFILKYQITDLEPDQEYQYRILAGEDSMNFLTSETARFKTLGGETSSSSRSMVVVTGMNYYHFHFGKYNRSKAYKGSDKELGYPALETIARMEPDYFVGTGDNVYFDHPHEREFKKNQERGNDPHPGWFGGREARNEEEIRRKYHVQFAQPRFKELFKNVATYWEKDDHDYRFNDADPYRDFPIAHDLGIKNFREQLPVVPPDEEGTVTYRTYRINEGLQVWFVEGRDYRSNNLMEDGPEKTLWGKEQIAWLKKTLSESDAPFKLLISPTPLVGPDDAYKKDNHVNTLGFRYERDQFFSWLDSTGIMSNGFYSVCGDRHWQYHSIEPAGLEEFSCGALVDNNSRAGRLAGDPKSTDPEAKIRQVYIQGDAESATGGFLHIESAKNDNTYILSFKFYDENGELLYEHVKRKQ